MKTIKAHHLAVIFYLLFLLSSVITVIHFLVYLVKGIEFNWLPLIITCTFFLLMLVFMSIMTYREFMYRYKKQVGENIKEENQKEGTI